MVEWKEEYYFAYYRRNGIVYCMKWHIDMPLLDDPIDGTKVSITEQEFYGSLDNLKEKYPFKE